MINYICLVEILIVAIIMVIIALKLYKKSLNKMFLFQGLLVLILFVGLGVTVSFKNPKVDIQDKLTLQIGTT